MSRIGLKILISSLWIATFLISISCQNNKPAETPTIKEKERAAVQIQVQTQTVKKPEKPAVQIHPKYNDIALILAGMAPNESCEFSEFTKNLAWRKYADVANLNWSGFFKIQAGKVQSWAAKEIGDAHKNSKTLFYPFSGPDFLYAFLLFPNAGKYVLIGLEPVGTISDPRQIAEDLLGSYFTSIGEAINDALSISFFRKNDLDEKLTTQEVDGTLPVLMLFLARTRNEIVDIKPVELTSEGDIAYLDSFTGLKGKEGYNKGVEVSFKTENNGFLKRLYYFSCNLSNSGLRRNPQGKLFLEKLEDGVTTFIKSATYLMHKTYFSKIRNAILSKSNLVVQDDSGISFRFFDKSIWDIQLYGTYEMPIDMFKEHLEEDLKEAYAKGSKPLGFRIGYSRKSNLLVARRKSQNCR